MTEPLPRTRPLTIVAQDPSVRDDKRRILTTTVDIPAESLAPGPRGARVHVIDYDASTSTLYKPFAYPEPRSGPLEDPFASPSEDTIVGDPRFHAQNVYAIVMKTLARFEYALGRRIGWGCSGGETHQLHQIKVAPHAFADANAFYSRRDEALIFGYFPARKQGSHVFTCLSHDIVAHETCHALLDGLRPRFMDPSSPDQAGFHEGLADVVALLSVFSLHPIVETLLDRAAASKTPDSRRRPGLIHKSLITPSALRDSILWGLAEEMGQELSTVRGNALRQSAKLEPSTAYLEDPNFAEPHFRGEILVAAVMNAFLKVVLHRTRGLGFLERDYYDRARVSELAADGADYLLTMAIRAIDYTPPTHLNFSDYLSALLTADNEIRPDDSRYGFREALRQSFAGYGIHPSSKNDPAGLWDRKDPLAFRYDRVHFEALGRDPDEMFRFVWENRAALGLEERAFTEVISLRPCLRRAPDDGFPLKETVAECLQRVTLDAAELVRFGITKPEGMPDDQKVTLRGGTTLLFDEFGRLKFSIGTHVTNPESQTRHLQYLWDYGFFRPGASLLPRFSNLHRNRAMRSRRRIKEEW